MRRPGRAGTQAGSNRVAATTPVAAAKRPLGAVLAAEGRADAVTAILSGLLVAVLGRAMTGADPADLRFRQHLADQMLRGVVTG
jgi:hypothetical protein